MEINRLYSQIFHGTETAENESTFSPSFLALQRKTRKRLKNYRWRSRRRPAARAHRMERESHDAAMARVVDEWFEEKTQEYHQQQKEKEAKKNRLREQRMKRRAERKSLKLAGDNANLPKVTEASSIVEEKEEA